MKRPLSKLAVRLDPAHATLTAEYCRGLSASTEPFSTKVFPGRA